MARLTQGPTATTDCTVWGLSAGDASDRRHTHIRILLLYVSCCLALKSSEQERGAYYADNIFSPKETMLAAAGRGEEYLRCYSGSELRKEAS